jgi:membrane associated rhomboid family serine protease
VIGEVLTSNPAIPTIGASGAVFALMGAAVVGLRNRGINPWRTDIGTLVLLNLGITFFLPGISVGGTSGACWRAWRSASSCSSSTSAGAGPPSWRCSPAVAMVAASIVLAHVMVEALLAT